jgi:hypothetical protein
MTTYPLGRKLQPDHDPRNRAPQYAAAKATALVTKTWRHWGPILDQGNLGSCTGNAVTQARNCVPLRQGRPLLDEVDAVKAYSLATQLDPYTGTYPPTDTGSDGGAACKAAQRLGWIDAYHWAFGLDEVLHALVLSPVIIGIRWTSDMFSPDPEGYVHPGGEVAGGHEVCLRSVNVEKRRVRAVNSWSASWGPLGGEFLLSWDDLDGLLGQDGDCTVPVVYPR